MQSCRSFRTYCFFTYIRILLFNTSFEFKYSRITNIYFPAKKTQYHSDILDNSNQNKWTIYLADLHIFIWVNNYQQSYILTYCSHRNTFYSYYLFYKLFKYFLKKCSPVLSYDFNVMTFNCKVWNELMRGASSANHRGKCIIQC